MDVVAWVRCVVLVALLLAVTPPALFGVGVNAEPGNEAVLRIEERLTTDREFYDQWIHLVELQARLGLEQRRDYPAEPESTLEACDNSAAISEDHADNLRPVDIEMFAEMGHLSAYCEHNLTALSSGHLDHCAHRTRESSLPSLLRYLRVFNPHLIHVHSNDLRTSLSEQARAISESMKRQPNYGDRWKMIVIAASIQDGEASETGQTAVEVLDTIEELNRLLPHRTFIVAVRTSGSGLWQDASHSHAACRAMLSRWKLHSQFNMESVWDQVNLITERNFQTPNFTVEILPLLKRPQLINLPESMDLSALGYDCAHMSEFGLAALQQEIWNSLFTLPNERSEDFRPLPKNLICPAKNCPFFRTGRNSAVCVWNPIEITDDDDTIRKLIVIAALLVALILTCIVICILCCYRNRKDYKKPLNPFGYDLDSIKFIDEDVN